MGGKRGSRLCLFIRKRECDGEDDGVGAGMVKGHVLRLWVTFGE